MALRQLDTVYSSVVDAMSAALKGEADAVLQGNAGLDKAAHFAIKKHTFAEIHKGFSRQKLEGEYQKLYDSDALTVQDATGLVTQSDALAGLEKAYQMRHRRRLDHFISGTSRANGQAQEKGFVQYAMRTIPLLGEPSA